MLRGDGHALAALDTPHLVEEALALESGEMNLRT